MIWRASNRYFQLFLAVLAFAVLPALNAAHAQRGRSLPLVRDAEIEALIRDYTGPIFRAGGLQKGYVEVFLLNRLDFNAFVTGKRMFIHTGAIMQSETPNEIIGVLAHETGHIIGGHLTRLRQRLERAQVLSVLGLLAAGGAVAGGSGQAGAALALGSASAVQRDLLSYQRSEEMAADRSGLTLLDKTKQSGVGMLTTFKRLGQNPLFSSGRLDPYALSHPLPRERIGLLQTSVQASPYYGRKDPPDLQLRHDMARAKIAAYAGGASMVRNILGKKLAGPAGTYGIAISHFLRGTPSKGLALMDRLIAQQPNNPYFHEMKGEILLRSGKASQAATSFRKAVSLEGGKSGLLRIQLGHALLETNNAANLDAAIKVLKEGIARDRYSSNGFGYLARAHARKGDQVLAMAATAEEKFLQGNISQAKQFALRAQPKIKAGSPQWVRLQDIIQFKPGA